MMFGFMGISHPDCCSPIALGLAHVTCQPRMWACAFSCARVRTCSIAGSARLHKAKVLYGGAKM